MLPLRHFLLLIFGLPLLARSESAPTSTPPLPEPSYRDIGLDCGGWFTGLEQHSSGRIYGFGDVFGVWRTEDFGETWISLQDGFTEAATIIVGMGIAPSDADVVAFSTYRDVWSSEDAGATWTKRLDDIADVIHTRGSRPLAYHPENPAELWFAGPRRNQTATLWRSLDRGATWAAIDAPAFRDERAVTIHLHATHPREIWIGTRAIPGRSAHGGLWCSADAGATWTKVWDNHREATRYFGAPAVANIARNRDRISYFSTNTGVWRVTASDWGDPATYRTEQAFWATHNIPNVTVLADGTFYASEIGDQDWPPKFSTDGVVWEDRPALLTAAYVPVWTRAEQIHARPHVYGRDMIVQDIHDPSRLLLTGGAGPHRSDDGGHTWRYAPQNLAGMVAYRVSFDRTNADRAYLAVSDHGAAVVTDGGRSGRAAFSVNSSFGVMITGHEVMASADGGTLVVAGLQQAKNENLIVRSTDGGGTWTAITPAGLPDSHEGIVHAVMSPDDPDDFLVLLGHTNQPGRPNHPGVHRTRDGGRTFSPSTGLPEGVDTGMRYRPANSSLVRDGGDPAVRYLALRAGNAPAARGVWRSRDGGDSWTLLGNPFADALPADFAIDPRKHGNLFGEDGGLELRLVLAADPAYTGRLWLAGGPAGVRFSSDGGDSWGVIPGFIEATALDAVGGRVAVIGKREGDTFSRIYYSPDSGATWRDMTTPHQRFAWALAVNVDPWRPGQLWLSGPRSVSVINPPSASNPSITGQYPNPRHEYALPPSPTDP
jgi:hypothetical protein